MRGNRKQRAAAAAAVVTALLLAAAPAVADELWFHVKVDERTGERSNVTVNLPFSIVQLALPLIPDEAMHHGHLRMGCDRDLDARQLRALWKAVSSSPDMTFITVESEGENVRVAKDHELLLVRSDEHRAGKSHVDVRIPLNVIDALLSGDGDELDVQAALTVLAQRGEGELVSVDDSDAMVRVWVDHRSEGK